MKIISRAVPLIAGLVLAVCVERFVMAQRVEQPPAASASWRKYTLAVKASCVSTNPCWTVNGVEGADLTAGLTQDVTLFTLPAKGYVEQIRIKTGTAFAGTTTATAKLGTSASDTFFLSTAYNLKTAVSATNFAPATGILAGYGSTTTASIAFVVLITTTVENISSLTTGSVDVLVKTSVTP